MRRRVGNVDIDSLAVMPGEAILDIGCGEGHLARELARAGFRVTGVEPEQRLRTAFELKGTDLDPERYRVVDARAEALPFPDQSWRAIVMTEVLEHVQEPERVLGEIRRVLAPGGRVCLAVPTSYTEHVFAFLHPRYLTNATHLRIFKKGDLLGLLERSGFDVVRIEGRNFEASVSWIFHAVLRSEADHAGTIREHLWVDRGLANFWGLLARLRLLGPVFAVGNRLLPKSWYVYAEAAS